MSFDPAFSIRNLLPVAIQLSISWKKVDSQNQNRPRGRKIIRDTLEPEEHFMSNYISHDSSVQLMICFQGCSDDNIPVLSLSTTGLFSCRCLTPVLSLSTYRSFLVSYTGLFVVYLPIFFWFRIPVLSLPTYRSFRCLPPVFSLSTTGLFFVYYRSFLCLTPVFSVSTTGLVCVSHRFCLCLTPVFSFVYYYPTGTGGLVCVRLFPNTRVRVEFEAVHWL
jgi:hypothetical protein